MDIVDYVIMAQGMTSYHKLPIGDTNIIGRTINMFSSYGNVHVVCDDRLTPHFDRNSVNRVLTLQGEVGSLLRGIHIILTHKFHTSSKVVFLYGDVIYSHRMRDLIVNHDDSFPALFGRNGENEFTDKPKPEIFALSVGNDWFSFISNITFELWQGNELNTVWDLEDRYGISILELDNDYTDDIDKASDYIRFYPKLRELAEDEDSRIDY